MAFTLQLSGTIETIQKPSFYTNPITLTSKKLTFPGARSGVSARRATTLLEVEAAAATPHTEGVGLVPPLTETPRSLTLQTFTIQTPSASSSSQNRTNLKSV